MNSPVFPRRAIISVADKSGLERLAAALKRHGYELVASGGTADHLIEAGFTVTDVAEITGIPPILGHRVVTLHPAIHSGILADTSVEKHVAELMEYGFAPFQIVIGGLYKFAEDPGIEKIDVGGPALIRAAAKNLARVASISSDDQYAELIEMLDMYEGEPGNLHYRLQLAATAFNTTAAFDTMVTAWLREQAYPKLG